MPVPGTIALSSIPVDVDVDVVVALASAAKVKVARECIVFDIVVRRVCTSFVTIASMQEGADKRKEIKVRHR